MSDNNNNEILIWKCKKCGKVIKSLYQNQLDVNINSHEVAHKIIDEV